jgi:hypothetical protein
MIHPFFSQDRKTLDGLPARFRASFINDRRVFYMMMVLKGSRTRSILVVGLIIFTALPLVLTSNVRGQMVYVLERPEGIRLGILGDPSTTMSISWWTFSNETDSRVYFGLSTGNYSSGNFSRETAGIMANVGTGFLHSVNLTGLLPETTYSYICGGKSGNSTIRNFTTAPSKRGDSPVHFVAFGDTREEGDRLEIMASMIVNESSPDPGNMPVLALHTGDVGGDGTDQSLYNKYSADIEPVASIMPVMHVGGNNDYQGTESIYPLQFVEPENAHEGNVTGWFYSFDWGPVHFIACDSEYSQHGSEPNPWHLFWLEQDLIAVRNDSSITWIVVWFHDSPYVSFQYEEASGLHSTFCRFFEQNGVDLVITGHNNGYQRNYPVNISWLTYEDGDPHYNDPPFPLYVVSGSGSRHVEGTTEGNLRDDAYMANSSVMNGSKAFFPSNHFLNVTVTVNLTSMTSRLWMDVIGLNYTEPGLSVTNYSTILVDQASITKNVSSNYVSGPPIEPLGEIESMILIMGTGIGIMVGCMAGLVVITNRISIKKKSKIKVKKSNV